MYEITVQLPFNGFHVKGILSLPVKAKSLIIFSHGFGSAFLTPHERLLSNKLLNEGYGTLVFDLLDEHDELPDDYKNIELLSHGLSTSTDWLCGHAEYQSLDLAYIGTGTGAAIALKTASKPNSKIKTVVSMSGHLDKVKEDLKKVSCPTLLVAGELDFKVADINRRALKHLTGTQTKQLAIVPGASHLYEEPGKMEEAAKIAISWFEKYLATGKESTLTH